MQPAQLSLLSEQCPAPPGMVVAELPEPAVAAAVALLAQLIARMVSGENGDRDE